MAFKVIVYSEVAGLLKCGLQNGEIPEFISTDTDVNRYFAALRVVNQTLNFRQIMDVD